VRVDILYFAWMREAVGVAQEQVDIPVEVGTVADLAAWLTTRSAGHLAALGDSQKLRCAVNQQMAAPDARLEGAREIAFFPPVTGG
jgi:molybdopterin synthase sulfur carrier subunit